MKITRMLREMVDHLSSKNGRNRIRYGVATLFLNPLARRIGYTIVADLYYQPIPNDKELLTYANNERPLGAIDWRIDSQIQFVREIFSKYCDEFNDESILSSFCYKNPRPQNSSNGDKEFLYSLIRDKKPRSVIEIGAGRSTQIIAAALKMNFAETQEKAGLISIDPYPQQFLKNLKGNVDSFMEFVLLEEFVQCSDLSMFESLETNDILYVDSSHVFKQGSDVEFEFLSIYPILNKGVIVHIHDIFFPFDYPLDWNMKKYRFWNEQYFLETFLLFNGDFKVLASLSMVAHYDKAVFFDTIKAYHGTGRSGAFWMRRV